MGSGEMSALETDISFGREQMSVELINEVNDEKPCEFKYIPSCTGGPGVELHFSSSYYPGCTCEQECCSDEQCECIGRYGLVYDCNCCLLLADDEKGISQPLFECNSSCRCPKSCSNRVVQKGLHTKLQVFRTVSRGWGVRTLEHIRKNQFVCEYAGEIITYKEAKRRAQGISGTGHYIVVLREHQAGNQVLRTHVDSQYCGNAARFMNHACSPNLFITSVRMNSIVPRLALFAARDIQSGEELCFDYSGGSDFCSSLGNEVCGVADTSITKTQCLCETKSCKGYLPYDPMLYNIAQDL